MHRHQNDCRSYNHRYISENAHKNHARLFRQAGYAPHVVLECDYTLRASLIASNFGVALTSASARAVDLLKPNRYIRVADPYAVRRMYLYHNPRQYMTQAAQDFLSFSIDYYKPQSTATV